MITNKNKKHIVLVGGGFAGLNFARKLFKNKYYEVTLVDKNNYNYSISFGEFNIIWI